MRQQLQQAFISYQRGDAVQAGQICEAILARWPGQPDALHLKALMAKDRGSLEEARRLTEEGLQRAPGHVHLLNTAGLLEKQTGDFDRSEACFRKAINADPRYFQARHNLAKLYKAQRRLSDAENLFREVIEQQPKFTDALANLSEILESKHDLENARLYAQRALAIKPENFAARVTLANIAMREKSFEAVLEQLAPLVRKRQLSPVNHSIACAKCAFAHEKIGDYEAAFGLFQQSNDVLLNSFTIPPQEAASLYAPASVDCIIEAIPDFEFGASTGDNDSPVFLVGFPRSGTTLLDQILSSHSQITVLEEKENLLDAHALFPATPAGLGALENAGEVELESLRQKYWENVALEPGFEQGTRLVVDKLPLNSVALLHISKLFPGAKVIVALRDPRDCVFSCYQQTFGLSQAMFQFLSLESAAVYYDKVMSVISRIEGSGAFPMHFVRYERVIENFNGETGDLVHFLGLEWEDSLHEYAATAKSRHINTPSAHQVIQPLYSSSIGKWKHYQEWTGSRFAPLDKWVVEWDYGA